MVEFDEVTNGLGWRWSEYLGLFGSSIAALIVQDPFRMGYEGVKTALAASKGEKVEEKIDTGVSVITKENMEEPRSRELLNPKLK